MNARALALLPPLLLGACAEREPEPPVAQQTEPEPEPIVCDCVLSSWVVAARGRHLHLDIDCPEEFDHLDGRIEFTSAALRFDYDGSIARDTPRLVRMSPGERLYSPSPEPSPREEASYEVDVVVAAWLQQDRAFRAPYVLVGTNSNSAMRDVLERAGLELPDHVLDGAGIFGPFPGIDRDPGPEIPWDEWAAIGLVDGPVHPEGPLPDGWETVEETDDEDPS